LVATNGAPSSPVNLSEVVAGTIKATVGGVSYRKLINDVGSICEFGVSRPDFAEVHAPLAKTLRDAIAARVRDAQRDGDVASNLDPEAASEFLIANNACIRLAGRGGANRAALTGLADMALRALR
jgi:TetR/AcrR family transcriptional repressor of nem operon